MVDASNGPLDVRDIFARQKWEVFACQSVRHGMNIRAEGMFERASQSASELKAIDDRWGFVLLPISGSLGDPDASLSVFTTRWIDSSARHGISGRAARAHLG